MLRFFKKNKDKDSELFEETVRELDLYAERLNGQHNARVMGNDVIVSSISRLVRAMGEANKSSKQEGKTMFILTIILGIVAILQLFIAYGQFKLSEVQIDFAHEQTVTQNAVWEYEKMRNDRLETRDVDWRREDLEAQGRLPIYK